MPGDRRRERPHLGAWSGADDAGANESGNNFARNRSGPRGPHRAGQPGDQAAFQQFYDRTSAKLFGVVLRIVKGRELADEVLQDSYLRIWQNASRYVPDSGRPMTWMIAIARYAAIDVVRKRSQDANYTPIDPPEPPASPERQVMVRTCWALPRPARRASARMRRAGLLQRLLARRTGTPFQRAGPDHQNVASPGA